MSFFTRSAKRSELSEHKINAVAADNKMAAEDNGVGMMTPPAAAAVQDEGDPATMKPENGVATNENGDEEAQDQQQDVDQYEDEVVDDQEENETSSSSPNDFKSSFVATEDEYNATNDEDKRLTLSELVKENCYPLGLPREAISLVLCLIALVMTFCGSWDCSYFNGATISFTGNSYGLWTLEDIEGKCQRWDVLFYNFDLGAPLVAARIFSMAAMLIGMGILITMCQATQLHCVSWLIGIATFICFIISVSTSSIYNVWIIFFLFTYVILILIVRALFIHPIHRQISKRGNKVIAGFVFLCGVCSALTFVVLSSDFCTCRRITSATLAGRDPGSPCDQECSLGPAGIVTICATIFWFLTVLAVLKFGVQPPVAQDEELESMYADYPRGSIFTRVTNQQAKLSSELKKKTVNISKHRKESDKNIVSSVTMSGLNGNTRVDNDEEEDEASFKRSRCQKICCDYRVPPRSRKEKWAFWSFRVALGLLVVIYVFLIVILCGARGENTTAAKAPDTSSYFITDTVCAFNADDPAQPFETFDTKEEAHLANRTVAHCGGCGVCSNPHDINVYLETRETIARSSKKCGAKAMLGSYNSLVKCLEGKIGFTRDCTGCWADNMKSTGSNCLFTCMVTMFTGFMSNNNVPGSGDEGWLNQCLFCDEKISGPAFVTCSGVARRRLGIRSEIERNPEQQCKKTDVDWLEDEVFQDY